MPRTPRRFFVDAPFPHESTLVPLSPRETFHLYRVLRLKVGDVCEIFNREGSGAEAVVESLPESGGAHLRLKRLVPSPRRSLWLNVAQALPQRRKMDQLVDWAAELGVHQLWVMETHRTIVKMSREAREHSRDRWDRRVIEACKQSRNPLLTSIEGPATFEKILREEAPKSDQSYLFHPDPRGRPFSEAMEELRSLRREKGDVSVFLFLGPEGGFTESEVKQAESRGVQKIFLGESTLRLEVAFSGVLSSLRFLVG